MVTTDASTLVCHGVFFGCDGFLRTNFGFGVDHVADALATVAPVMEKIAEEAPE